MSIDHGENFAFLSESQKATSDTTDKPFVAIPINANPALVDLLEWYCSHRIN
jgi:hypothetical protein